MRFVRPAPVPRAAAALLAAAVLPLTACGGGPPAAAPSTRPGTTQPAPSVERAEPPGTWTSDVRPNGPVTDGNLIVGTTRTPGDATTVVALDAGTGATRWAVALGTKADARAGRPSLLLPADGPLVATHQLDTDGSDTGGQVRWRVARLDPASGRTLWAVDTTGPAVAAGPDVVLVEQRRGGQTAAQGTLALDPADGHRLWTAASNPVLTGSGAAVLTAQDTGPSTVLTGVDASTGEPRWTSSSWGPDAVGSRSTALVANAGHLLVALTTTRLADETTVLQVRDLAAGRPVGPALPAPQLPAAELDTSTGTAVVHEAQEGQGATTGVYGVDMTTGRTLWTLAGPKATTATVAGAGLVWVKGSDGGYSAIDVRAGTARAQRLDLAPVVVLDRAQVTDGGSALRATPLP